MDEERFFAWLDGELAPDEAKLVAAMVAEDPALAAQADQHHQLAAQLRAAFDPVFEQDSSDFVPNGTRTGDRATS